MQARGAFLNKVFTSKGQLSYSVRELLGDQFFRAETPGPRGHHYLNFTSLGRTALSPELIMGLITEDLGSVFPYFTPVGEYGQRVRVENKFLLTLPGRHSTGHPVEVISTTPYTFTLQTLPGHPLQGTVTHGVFKDSTGEAWLFHEGIGVPGEATIQQQFNNRVARDIWPAMARRLMQRMSTVSAR
jgi:hypothetical protein